MSENKENLTTAEWEKLKPEEMIRGQTIEGLERKCLDLCHAYLGGSWLNAKSTDDISVSRISGGLTNQLYRVELKTTVKRVPNQVYPQEPGVVAIKLYQEKHIKNYETEVAGERLNDMIILTIMSQEKLGPQVYGIFNDGFIQGFHKHEQFRAKHQAVDSLVAKVADLAARINHLQVPISKTPNLLFAELRKFIHYAYDNLQIKELTDKFGLKTLQSKDLRQEFDDFTSLMDSLEIPIVFCHNDFRGNNLLVLDNQKDILVCDLEYAGYGWRGYDLANVLFEWGKANFFDFSEKIPTDDQIRVVVRLYIKACDRLVPGYSARPENSVDRHVREVKCMFLGNYLFLLGMMIVRTEPVMPSVPFDITRKMFALEQFYGFYHAIKASLIKDGTVGQF